MTGENKHASTQGCNAAYARTGRAGECLRLAAKTNMYNKCVCRETSVETLHNKLHPPRTSGPGSDWPDDARLTCSRCCETRNLRAVLKALGARETLDIALATKCAKRTDRTRTSKERCYMRQHCVLLRNVQTSVWEVTRRQWDHGRKETNHTNETTVTRCVRRVTRRGQWPASYVKPETCIACDMRL